MNLVMQLSFPQQTLQTSTVVPEGSGRSARPSEGPQVAVWLGMWGA